MDNVSGRHQPGWIAISISIDEYESIKETIEILSDVDIMKQLEEGKKVDIKIRDFENIATELGI